MVSLLRFLLQNIQGRQGMVKERILEHQKSKTAGQKHRHTHESNAFLFHHQRQNVALSRLRDYTLFTKSPSHFKFQDKNGLRVRGLKGIDWVSEVAQYINELITKPDDQSFKSGTHMKEN